MSDGDFELNLSLSGIGFTHTVVSVVLFLLS